MKQIFDWLRDYIYRNTYKNDVEVITQEDALAMVDEAEAKWEADCCEWEWFEVDGVRTYANCKYSRDTLDLREMADFKFCPYCGRKISEVE
jgi:hypothetical protein